MVEFSLMNMGLSSFTLGMDPNSGLGVSLSQDFSFPGKLRLKGEIAASAYQRKLEELAICDPFSGPRSSPPAS